MSSRRKQSFEKDDPDSSLGGNKLMRRSDPEAQLDGNKKRTTNSNLIIQTAQSSGDLSNSFKRKRTNETATIILDGNDDFQDMETTISTSRLVRNSRYNQTDEERANERGLNRKRMAVRREAEGKMSQARKEHTYLKATESKNIEAYKLSEFNVLCKHCNAIHFQEEHAKSSKKENEFYDCCDYGKLENLDQLIDDYPEEMKVLFLNGDGNSKHFINNIRRYNSSFACASLACSRFKFPSSYGPPCFKISGQIYHKFNQNAQPDNDETPTNGQLYFIDTDQAANDRINDECDKDVLDILEKCLRENYPYAEAYMMMQEVLSEQEEIARQNKSEIPELKLLFSLKQGYDARRYNLPRVNEVAAIFVCDANGDVPPANIVVHLKGAKNLINLRPLDPNVEPMIYPLLYPNKTKGWHTQIEDQNKKRITLCDFIKYRLFVRNSDKFFPHHYSRKLFQQWVVDQAARVEWNNLEFIKFHQKEIKASNYKGLNDYLIRRSEQTGLDVGKQIVLPSSFTGGPRNKDQHYMDSMAIVGEFGKPDLFITMTCDPHDNDILKCLLGNQTASDRPDIVARVFKQKVEKLIEDIVKGQIFGESVGYCWTIEFQKRGLPHIHLLVTLHAKDKLRTKDDVDKFISCEIPDEIEDPELFEIISRCNVHGPCGKDHPYAPCWNKEKKFARRNTRENLERKPH